MRAKDTRRVGVLRTTLAAIANAEAVDPGEPHEPAGLRGDVARRHLTEDDVRSIVVAELADLRATAAEMAAVGQAAEADDFTAMAAILEAYLTEP